MKTLIRLHLCNGSTLDFESEYDFDKAFVDITQGSAFVKIGDVFVNVLQICAIEDVTVKAIPIEIGCGNTRCS